MQNKHSPLPWKTHSIIRPFYTLLDRDGIALADFALPLPRENSEFIESACNNHYQLINALKEAQIYIECQITQVMPKKGVLDGKTMLKVLNQALKLEKGESHAK